MKINTYYPENLTDLGSSLWFELLRVKRKAEKGSVASGQKQILEQMRFVDSMEEASLCILPMDWNYYFQHKKIKPAKEFVEQAASKGKIIFSSTSGDSGISVNVPMNCWVYRISGYRSTMRKNERPHPYFLSDPIEVFFKNQEQKVVKKNTDHQPVVGFCGMAPDDLLTWTIEPLRILLKNWQRKLKLHPFDQQKVMSSSRLRVRTLQQFQSNNHFTTNFIIRKKYRAGATTAADKKKTTLEYYNNQFESDFNICVRGGGNFSARFYETLAMGRIPVFVDTDTPLPDITPHNWDDHMVRCHVKDLGNITQIINNWIKDKEINQLFRKNRVLWKEHLSFQGFWLKEMETFRQQVHHLD